MSTFFNRVNEYSSELLLLSTLQPTSFDQEQTQKLRERIPQNLIINICGMAGVGKGTLCEELAQRLNIPYVYTGKIWRAITYIYIHYNCPISQENNCKILSLLGCQLQNNEVQFYYHDLSKIPSLKDKHLTEIKFPVLQRALLEYAQESICPLSHHDLKNAVIDSKVPVYAGDWDLHQQFFQKAVEVYQSIQKAFVRDGRGANPVDLRKMEEKGFQVLKILLDCRDEVKWQRYKKAVFYNRRANNWNIENTEEFEQKIWLEFQENILKRNQKDQEIQTKLGNNLISSDTVLLDNSDLSIEETVQTALAYIDSQI